MVTQDGDHTVRMVVRVQFLLNRAFLGRTTVKEILERQRRVVGTEHLRSQALHVRCQMTVERTRLSLIQVADVNNTSHSKRIGTQTHVDTIEQFILGILAILEDPDILVHLLIYCDLVVIPD